MSFLNNLPQELLSPVLSTWLTIVDVTQLDSALCNHNLRGEFLDRAYKFGDVLQYPDSSSIWDDSCGPMTDWIFDKGAPVAGFYAVSNFLFSHTKREKYLQNHGDSIRWIEFAPTLGREKNYDLCRLVTVQLALYCPKLNRLNAADRLDDVALKPVLDMCPMLEDIALGGDGYTSRTVTEMSRKFKKLLRVELLSEHVSEKSLITLVRKNPGLVSFFTCAKGATDTFFRALALSCSGLTKLLLSFISVAHASLCILMTQCPHLQRLALDGVTYTITDQKEAEPVLCPSMQLLHFDKVHSYEDLTALGRLMRACRNLTSLDIWECPALPEDAILPIAERFPSLQEVKLYDCGVPVTDELLIDISTHYPQLRELEIPFSEDVTHTGLVAVATHCPNLQRVDVQNCDGVTDAFLLALARNCPDLQVLLVAGCSEITDRSVKAVMKRCADLVKLGVEDCIGLTDKLTEQVCARYPYSW
jgi:hypothetical protein